MYVSPHNSPMNSFYPNICTFSRYVSCPSLPWLLLFTPFTATWSKSIPNHLWWWDFAPYVSGFCHIHGKTPRGILPVNSNPRFKYCFLHKNTQESVVFPISWVLTILKCFVSVLGKWTESLDFTDFLQCDLILTFSPHSTDSFGYSSNPGNGWAPRLKYAFTGARI